MTKKVRPSSVSVGEITANESANHPCQQVSPDYLIRLTRNLRSAGEITRVETRHFFFFHLLIAKFFASIFCKVKEQNRTIS